MGQNKTVTEYENFIKSSLRSEMLPLLIMRKVPLQVPTPKLNPVGMG